MNDKKDIIVVTDKEQANQIFEEMKSREVDRLNFNYSEIKRILTEVSDKVYSENRVSAQKELTDLKDLINTYIGIVRKIRLTTNEETHFGNEHLVKRNSEYKREAIKSLKSDLKVVKGKIKKTEAPEIVNSEYTVKSVLMAYYYMHRKKIYLISELQGPWVLKNIHEKLHQMYGFSTNSFKNDWNPIFKNGEKNPENIRLAIKLLRTFDDPRIKESIELANSELKEAELKP